MTRRRVHFRARCAIQCRDWPARSGAIVRSAIAHGPPVAGGSFVTVLCAQPAEIMRSLPELQRVGTCRGSGQARAGADIADTAPRASLSGAVADRAAAGSATFPTALRLGRYSETSFDRLRTRGERTAPQGLSGLGPFAAVAGAPVSRRAGLFPRKRSLLYPRPRRPRCRWPCFQ